MSTVEMKELKAQTRELQAQAVEVAEQVAGKVAEARQSATQLLRKVILTGVGSAALAVDEAESFVRRSMSRGEVAERDGRRLIKEIRETGARRTASAEETVATNVDWVFRRLNVPTRQDVHQLNSKINRLIEKVNTLIREENNDQDDIEALSEKIDSLTRRVEQLKAKTNVVPATINHNDHKEAKKAVELKVANKEHNN